MIVGDADNWIEHFRGFDNRLLARIVHLVPQCVETLGSNPYEDDITMNLVDRLTKDPVAREMFTFFEYQFEPFIFDDMGNAKSTGKIDLAAHIDQDRRTYCQ